MRENSNGSINPSRWTVNHGESTRVNEPSDEALVTNVANGDRTALAALYDRYAARLFGFARWLGLHDCEAENIVHDVFLDVWHYAGDFDPGKVTVETWISVRLRSRVIDHWRHPAHVAACGDNEGMAARREGGA
jgi:DNA-directed RNA polymerase specialized sigma24 family protein